MFNAQIYCISGAFLLRIRDGSISAMNFKFGRNIRRLNPSKRPLKFWRQGGVGIVRDSPKFSGQ